MTRALVVLVLILLCGAGAYAGYESLRSAALSAAYRNRLRDLSEDYADLAGRYSALVERTATTELVVQDGRLSVVVATLDGELRRIPTPFDPRREIHVDYVVREGRLWIRRVHDSATPADRALLVDPELAAPTWDGSTYGLSIYRPLDEGRWIVSVARNGALTLTQKSTGGEPTPLHAAPEVRPFERIDEEARSGAGDLSLFELAVGLWDSLAS